MAFLFCICFPLFTIIPRFFWNLQICIALEAERNFFTNSPTASPSSCCWPLLSERFFFSTFADIHSSAAKKRVEFQIEVQPGTDSSGGKLQEFSILFFFYPPLETIFFLCTVNFSTHLYIREKNSSSELPLCYLVLSCATIIIVCHRWSMLILCFIFALLQARATC